MLVCSCTCFDACSLQASTRTFSRYPAPVSGLSGAPTHTCRGSLSSYPALVSGLNGAPKHTCRGSCSRYPALVSGLSGVPKHTCTCSFSRYPALVSGLSGAPNAQILLRLGGVLFFLPRPGIWPKLLRMSFASFFAHAHFCRYPALVSGRTAQIPCRLGGAFLPYSALVSGPKLCSKGLPPHKT